MPVLKNPKHERFSQELAKGKTADEAYKLAGFKPNRGNASTLNTNQSIRDRVTELQQRSADRVEISIASVTENLLRIAQKAEVSDSPAGLSVARLAHMDVAKVHGLIVEKREVGKPGEFDSMSEAELADYIARRSGELGFGGEGAGVEAGEEEAGPAGRLN